MLRSMLRNNVFCGACPEQQERSGGMPAWMRSDGSKDGVLRNMLRNEAKTVKNTI